MSEKELQEGLQLNLVSCDVDATSGNSQKNVLVKPLGRFLREQTLSYGRRQHRPTHFAMQDQILVRSVNRVGGRNLVYPLKDITVFVSMNPAHIKLGVGEVFARESRERHGSPNHLC